MKKANNAYFNLVPALNDYKLKREFSKFSYLAPPSLYIFSNQGCFKASLATILSLELYIINLLIKSLTSLDILFQILS